MDFSTFSYFVVLSLFFVAIPGPNVLVIISTTINHGRVRGLQTVAGTGTAMIIQLTVAVSGTAGLISLLADSFYIIKWLGAGYLIYLGIKHAVSAIRPQVQPAISAGGSFLRGFFVSLTNPKTIIFFAAFLPQFVSSEVAAIPQLVLLSLAFWLIAIVLDSGYALLASSLKMLLRERRVHQISNAVSSVLFFVAGAWLALSRRTA